MFEAEAIPEEKSEYYDVILKQVKGLITGEPDTLANLANVASVLFYSLPDVNWAGFYIARHNQLVLGPFQGKPACIRIPYGRGVCGKAAKEQQPVLVKDVEQFEGHIPCDAASRSELVIPIIQNSSLVAILDIDSPTKERFCEQDLSGLSAVVQVLEAEINFAQLTY